jgi:hypothetical protein
MNVASARGMELEDSSTQLCVLCYTKRWVTSGTQNTTKHQHVRLETQSLNQCLPEGTTLRFSAILPGINTVCFFRSQIGNTTVCHRERTIMYNSI